MQMRECNVSGSDNKRFFEITRSALLKNGIDKNHNNAQDLDRYEFSLLFLANNNYDK